MLSSPYAQVPEYADSDAGSGGPLRRLGGWDAVRLYNQMPNLHQHTLKIAIVDASDC